MKYLIALISVSSLLFFASTATFANNLDNAKDQAKSAVCDSANFAVGRKPAQCK